MKFSTALLSALLLSLPLSAPPLFAQAEPLPASQWDKSLARLEALVTEGRYEEAEKRAGKLLTDMVNRIGFYEADPRFTARAVLYLAVAEMGLGQDDEARWHLYVARNLDRKLIGDDLERYGDTGVTAGRTPYRGLGKIPTEILAAEPKVAEGAAYRPLVLESNSSSRMVLPCTRVTYDRAHMPESITVEILVDPEGLPLQPRLVSRPKFPLFVLLALEQLQDWRYRPAAKGDQPIYTLDRQKIDFPCSSKL